jgi:nitroimidazol reductase NimA-like FMN-containing flavoprotein (pyridoxamine 5'-phosphate oxidase superfamily)/GNAT superfamily N-acetyltransferase
MRRPIFATSRERALHFLGSAHHVHLASTRPDGVPVLRALHGVLVDDAHLAFHAAPIGEKLEVLGRQAVVQASRVVAQIPSYFLDPERACPATTLYESVQAHGVVEEVTEPDRRATALEGLMRRLQPEGGYVPIEASSPLYRKALAGLFVAALRIESIDGKSKLMQHKQPRDRTRVIEQLWRRGDPGDVEAIESIRAANPEDAPPPFLRGPHGTTLAVALGPEDAHAAAQLVSGAYWNDAIAPAAIARATSASSAWVGARDGAGVLRATARAISDSAKHAWIYDVYVAEELRGAGVGDAVLRLLLDHPQVRHARFVHLGTRDAQPFYARLGFVDRAQLVRLLVHDHDAGSRASRSASESVAGPAASARADVRRAGFS